MFAWDGTMPEEAISVKVEHGWVTLSGTVDRFFQKDAARRAAGKINGVTGVGDLVAVWPAVRAGDVRDRPVNPVFRMPFSAPIMRA